MYDIEKTEMFFSELSEKSKRTEFKDALLLLAARIIHEADDDNTAYSILEHLSEDYKENE